MDAGDAVRVAISVFAFVAVAVAAVRLWPWPAPVFLNKEKRAAELIDVVELSDDTKRFRFSLGSRSTVLGLPVGKHLLISFSHPRPEQKTWNGAEDSEAGKTTIERRYTPISGNETPGTVDLVVKVYRHGEFKTPKGEVVNWADGGKAGHYFDRLQVGDLVMLRGPVGRNEYLGRGTFKLPGQAVTARRVGMMAGGTGLTPMLQVARAALRDPKDQTIFSLLYANKTAEDILCREALEELAQTSGGRFSVTLTLDFPPKGWEGQQGFVTQAMIQSCLPPPADDTLVLVCGPPPMVEHACKANLLALGYKASAVVVF